MGLRSRIHAKFRCWLDHFSGEYSAAAPTDPVPEAPAPAAQPGDVKVVRARLQRPRSTE